MAERVTVTLAAALFTLLAVGLALLPGTNAEVEMGVFAERVRRAAYRLADDSGAPPTRRNPLNDMPRARREMP
jgi:hypothetical protein